jgi:uncharacterized protein
VATTAQERPSTVRWSVPTAVGLFVALAAIPLWFWLGLPGGWVWKVVREWGLVIVLLAIVLYWERSPIRSIGVRQFRPSDVLWGVAGFLAGLIAFGVTIPLVQAIGSGADLAEGVGRVSALPLGVLVLLVVTAGITEEILFRGYPIERLAALTGNVWLGAIAAYVVFVGLHIPVFGVGGAIQIGAWSLVVTGLYVWRRNLAPCMIMHILNDAWAFLVIPMLVSLPGS